MLFKSHYAGFLLHNHIPTVSKILRRSEAKKSPYTHHKGSRGMDPLILKLGIRKRRVVKFTFGPIYDLKERRHALNTNIEYVRPYSLSGYFRDKRNHMALPGFKPRNFQSAAKSLQ